MPTTQMTKAEAEIMALFQQPSSPQTKVVRVSDEQVRLLEASTPEVRAALAKKIAEEGIDERTFRP